MQEVLVKGFTAMLNPPFLRQRWPNIACTHCTYSRRDAWPCVLDECRRRSFISVLIGLDI